jgi:Uma2 family endonuclease
MSAPVTTERSFAEQHAINCQAVERLWADPRYAQTDQTIETDRDGNPLMSPPPEWHHDIRKNRITVLLARLMPEGEALVETAVSTHAGAKVPDASWFSEERLRQRFEAAVDDRLTKVAPDLCVEVLSPNEEETLKAKRAAYFSVGVREVWLCDLDGTMRFYGPEGRLERSKICPDFPRRISADYRPRA